MRLALFLLILSRWAYPAPVQKIGSDLYAYISANDASSNSTFLIGKRGILVVDTGLNQTEGRRLLAEIRKFSPLPVRWIVNTHYHPDHRGGNSVVGPDAIIISTEYTREQALRSQARPARTKGRQPAMDYNLNEVVGFTPGDKAGMSLYAGGHEVRIYYPGPAHTRGDLVIYFPDQRAIATGDLFLNGSCPAMDDGDLENWIDALNHILSLPVDHFVPGHFGLASRIEVQRFRDYLAELRDQVARMYGQGLTLKQVKKGLDLSRYNDLRQFPQYEATFAANAAAYYRQLEAKAHSQSQQLRH